MSNVLPIHHQAMLLALRDEEGTIEQRAGQVSFALAGAAFAELLLEGRIAVSDDKKQLVTLVSDEPMHDEVLDECLGLIATAKRRRRASAWISRFTGVKKLKRRVAQSLCRAGILQESEDRVLLLFTHKIFPTIDPDPERRLIEQLRSAIFDDGTEVDPRIAITAALGHTTGLLRVPFDKKELEPRKERLEALASGDVAASAAAAAIQATQAAVMTAIIASTTAATVSSST